jgi:ketosteroid isomerase-like protein
MSAPLPSVIDGQGVALDPQHPLKTLGEFYRAFNSRDLEAMARNWAHGNEVSMSNPLGGIARGWPAIRAIYERIFHGPARVQVVFHDYSLHETDELFYVVGRERGMLVNGNTQLELAIRTSRIYRRIGGEWRQVHHHGSFDDAALLAAYHEAVMP